MTLKEIRDSVDLTTRSRWTVPQLNKFINKAYEEILSWSEWDFLRKTDTIIATSTQTVFKYPEDYRKAERLSLDDDTLENDGEVFTTDNQFFNIAPDPEDGRQRFEFNSAPKGNLKLRYLISPKPLSGDSDIPIAPETFHELIEVMASIRGLGKDNRDKGQLAILENDRKRLKGIVTTYQQSSPTDRKRMTPVGDDGTPIVVHIPLGDGY